MRKRAEAPRTRPEPTEVPDPHPGSKDAGEWLPGADARGSKSAFRMRFVPTKDATRFGTVGPKDPWLSGVTMRGFAFIRLQPPSGTSEELIAEYRKAAETEGAVVKYIPANEEAVVTDQAAPVIESKGIRETVLDLVREAKTDDPTSLTFLVEKTLAEVGL
jgi:hypothetical protein